MLGFFGGIIKNVLGRIVFMGLVMGGGWYYVQQNGGVAGVMEMAASEESPLAGLPLVAGLADMIPADAGNTPAARYYRQQGRISGINVQCRLRLQADGRLTRTAPMPCARARAARSDPKFAAYSVEKTRTATYIYYALDGVNVHTGTADLTGAMALRAVGDVIDIDVSSADPRVSRPI